MSELPVAVDDGSPVQPPESGAGAAATPDNDKTRFRMPPPAAARDGSGRGGPVREGAERKATVPSAGGSTGSGWGDPALWADAGPVPGVGSVINNRFVLEESIGTGGMGTVFKARDLRKVEAQDRNPHVAIKVLNEEFRRHPQALQALQRESRKTQKLAHPNIVTVYDFDRDGANVYMVMELLEGEPLDRLVKRNDGLGLGVKEALRLTQGICRAMTYAHEQGIVHADFKPANAFLTHDNVIKVLDFGIARAVKHSEQVSGVMTVFDPGTLGALTPAYAGCEVIEGEEADARDDIYAIACVAYELIAGRHPFDRLSAAQARDAGVTPQPPPGLSKRQWRTLRRGLSFRRDQRPRSVPEFFDGLRPLPLLPAVYAAGGGLAIAAVVILVMLVSGQIQKFHERSVARALASADAHQIEPMLPELRKLEPDRRASLFLDEKARTGFVRYFQNRIDALVDARTGHYDYQGAAAVLAELEEFLPDSQAVQDIRERLNAKMAVAKAAAVAAAATAAENATAAAASAPVSQASQGQQAPPVAAGTAAASNAAALARAAATPQAAPSAAPPAQALPTADELRAQIQRGLAQPNITLQQARVLAAAAEEMTRLRAPDAKDIELQLRIRLAQIAAGAEAAQGLDAAIEFTEGAYALYPESKALRKTLIDLHIAATQRASKQRDTQIVASRKKIESLLAATHIDIPWGVAFDRELLRLESALPVSDPYINQVKARASLVYVEQATALRGQQRFADAGHMLELSRKYEQDSAARAQEEKLLAAAVANQAEEARQRELAARVGALEQQLLEQAQADDVGGAQARLGEIRAEVPANDPFMTRDGPAAIAASYLRMASIAAKEGRFPQALDLVSHGRAVAPTLDQVAAARNRYGRYQTLDQYLTSRVRLDVRAVRTELTALAKQDPVEVAAATQGLLRNLVARINSTHDPDLASRLLQATREIFGEQSVASVSAHPVEPGSK
jgi:serine/threonine protein kinase